MNLDTHVFSGVSFVLLHLMKLLSNTFKRRSSPVPSPSISKRRFITLSAATKLIGFINDLRKSEENFVKVLEMCLSYRHLPSFYCFVEILYRKTNSLNIEMACFVSTEVK